MIDVKIGEPYTKLQFKQGGRLGPVWSCAAAAVIAESAAWAEEEETRTRVLLIPHSQTQTQLIFKCWKKVPCYVAVGWYYEQMQYYCIMMLPL